MSIGGSLQAVDLMSANVSLPRGFWTQAWNNAKFRKIGGHAPIWKGKGDAQDPGKYKGITLEARLYGFGFVDL